MSEKKHSNSITHTHTHIYITGIVLMTFAYKHHYDSILLIISMIAGLLVYVFIHTLLFVFLDDMVGDICVHCAL